MGESSRILADLIMPLTSNFAGDRVDGADLEVLDDQEVPAVVADGRECGGRGWGGGSALGRPS